MTKALMTHELSDLGSGILQSQRQIDMLRAATRSENLNDLEFDTYALVCRQTGLNPFLGEINAIRRGGKVSYEATINGFRKVAHDDPRYRGQTPPQWCDAEGTWYDVWLFNEPPAAAKVGVHIEGFKEPLWGLATLKEYQPKNIRGTWWDKNHGSHMLAKCAEAQALRKSIRRLTGTYTADEMEQAQTPIQARVEREPDSALMPRGNTSEPQTFDSVPVLDGFAGLGMESNQVEELVGYAIGDSITAEQRKELIALYRELRDKGKVEDKAVYTCRSCGQEKDNELIDTELMLCDECIDSGLSPEGENDDGQSQ